MNRFTYSLAAIALGSVAFLGCEKEDTTTASRTTTTTTPPSTGPAVDVDVDVNKDKIRDGAQRAGDAIERGAERTGAAIQSGTQRAGEAIREGAKDAKEMARDAGRRVDNAVDVDVNRTGDGDAVQAGARSAAPDAEGIRDVLAQAAEASVTKGGLDDLQERLVDADRNRLGDALNAEFPELDGRIEQFKKDFQAKYGQEFDITNEEQSLPNNLFAVTQSETPRGAAGAEVDVDVDRKADGTQTAKVDVDQKSGVDRPDSPAADANRNDPGRNLATVRVASSHGAPELTVPMIHEAPDQWKIDVPDSLTADKLKQNVLAHLTQLGQQKDKWPANVNEAHALVTHHVLMALMDKPVQQ